MSKKKSTWKTAPLNVFFMSSILLSAQKLLLDFALNAFEPRCQRLISWDVCSLAKHRACDCTILQWLLLSAWSPEQSSWSPEWCILPIVATVWRLCWKIRSNKECGGTYMAHDIAWLAEMTYNSASQLPSTSWRAKMNYKWAIMTVAAWTP